MVFGLSDDPSSLSPRPHSLASVPLPLPLLGTRSAYYLFIIKICLLNVDLQEASQRQQGEDRLQLPPSQQPFPLPTLLSTTMLSSSTDEHKTPRLRNLLDIKGYNATIPFLREVCEVARLSPSRYGSLHIDLQAMLPQLGSDVDLTRYASLPVPPVPPIRPTLASLPPRSGPPPPAMRLPADAPSDPPVVPPAGPPSAPERAATRSTARAPTGEDRGHEPPAMARTPVVEDRTTELEAAVEYYKDVLLPDYRDAKTAYEKRMVLHRACDAHLYELAIKNVTPAVIERLTRDHHESFLTASSPASGIALARLLLSSLKPTAHEKHMAQRDLYGQLEGLKQGKDTPMESHLHAFKTCHQRLLDMDYVLDEGAAIGIFVNGLHGRFRTIFETLRLQESVDTLLIAYSHASRAAEQVRIVESSAIRPSHYNVHLADSTSPTTGGKRTAQGRSKRKPRDADRTSAPSRKVSFTPGERSPVPRGRSPTPSGQGSTSRTVKFTTESKSPSGHYDSRIHCAFCWRTVQRTYRHSEAECNRKKDTKSPVQFAGLAVSSTQAHVNYGHTTRTRSGCRTGHLPSRRDTLPGVHRPRHPPTAHRPGYSAPAYRQGYSAPAYRQGYSAPAYRQGGSAPAYRQGWSTPTYRQGCLPRAYRQGCLAYRPGCFTSRAPYLRPLLSRPAEAESHEGSYRSRTYLQLCFRRYCESKPSSA